MAVPFPYDAATGATFDLEQEPASVLDLFNVVVSSIAGPTAWPQLNKEMPVRLFELPGKIPALHWWEYITRHGSSSRSGQHTAPIEGWLWDALHTDGMTPDAIREAGRAHGCIYPRSSVAGVGA